MSAVEPQIKVTKKSTGQNLFVGQQMQSERSLGITDVLTPNQEGEEAATNRNYSQFKDSHKLNVSINMPSPSVDVESQRHSLCEQSAESPVPKVKQARNINSIAKTFYDSHPKSQIKRTNDHQSFLNPKKIYNNRGRMKSLFLNKGILNSNLHHKIDKTHISSQERQVRSSLNN